jgi:formamidopyrimidine-DNA glycosylase
MPELPEVETIRRQLAPLVEGRVLARVEILDPRWSRPPAPAELTKAIQGRRIEALRRRGKYLVWSFQDDVFLAQHLRMTGAVLCEPEPEPTHVRVRMELEPKLRLVVVDPRRFGTGELLLGSAALDGFLSARLGVEPFDERVRSQKDAERRSRRCSSISGGWPAWATSMPMRRCTGRVCIPCALPDASRRRNTRACTPR